MRRRTQWGWAAALISVVGLAAVDARAALTPSELAQLRDAMTAATSTTNATRGATAARIRALVARPDLSDEESSQALVQAVAPLPFTVQRAALLKDVVFGGASIASRPVLAIAVVRSLLARADSQLAKFAGSLDKEPDAMNELLRIYTFLDREIAGAPGRRGIGQEPQNGISLAAYDECAKLVSQHSEKHPKWLRDEARLSAPASRVRAQAKLVLLDMMNETPTVRVDAADRLGLTGARRSFFTELGILALDTGVADDARIDRVRALVARMPAIRQTTSAIYFGEPKPDLVARGAVLGVSSSLDSGSSEGLTPVSSLSRVNIFPEEVDPGATDPVAVDLTRELSRVIVARALEKRPELRMRTERDIRAANGDASVLFGKPELKPEPVLVEAVVMLLLDAPRTVDLALVRQLGGRPESAAILSDALGILAVHSAPASAGGPAIALGKPRDDGSTDTVWATQTQLGPDGMVTAFTLAGARWQFARGESGVVTEARKDGTPTTLAVLGSARIPVREGSEWKSSGIAFTRLTGAPHAGVASGGRVRVTGSSTGLDTIATPAPANDFVVDADVKVQGSSGALLARASMTETNQIEALHAAGISIVPNQKTGSIRLFLRQFEGSSVRDLAAAQEIAWSPSIHVRVTLKGTRFEATAGTASFKATLPSTLSTGQIAVGAERGASVDVLGFVARKN